MRRSACLQSGACRPDACFSLQPQEAFGLDQRCSVTVTIVNRLGLHARPAMSFVDTASQFRCGVTVKRGDQEVDGKSIMHMMMLAATKGTALIIDATGEDAAPCCEALRKLVEAGFDED